MAESRQNVFDDHHHHQVDLAALMLGQDGRRSQLSVCLSRLSVESGGGCEVCEKASDED